MSIVFNNLQVPKKQERRYVYVGERAVSLGPSAYLLVEALVAARGELMCRVELERAVYGGRRQETSKAALDGLISAARQKLPGVIITVGHRGWRIDPKTVRTWR